MSLSTKYSGTEQLELDEFVDFAEKHVDVTKTDEVFGLGEQFSMLGRNRRFLSDFLSNYIKQRVIFDPLAAFVSQSIVIARRKSFYVRANFWLTAPEMNAEETLLFAYDQPHDHNFDLLSYAYCGSGYSTDIFEYNYENVAGYLGERVTINPLGRHLHGPGEVILYRCNTDIHTQFQPRTPSITLNFLPLHNQHGLRDQYFFDIKDTWSTEATISKYAYTSLEARRQVFDIVKHIATPEIVDLLAHVAINHACRRTRYHALQALADADAEAHSSVCRDLQSDSSPLIRHYLEREMQQKCSSGVNDSLLTVTSAVNAGRARNT